MTVVVGTAGHIDHGKTSLLRALTGIDADRLPEERRRGMTIDVGYAHHRLPDGEDLDFVDVPGHDRLVGNMLVGAGEIDAVLLVVAADDGPRAQTLEHLELLDGLGLRHGVVALTKVDLVADDRVREVADAITALVGRTTLAGAPIRPVSSTTGQGIEALLAALAALRERVASEPATARDRRGRPVRLAVDRAFTIRGRGLVVTGSLRAGRLARGMTLRVEPGSLTVRAREVQVHGEAVEAAVAGGRVAVNLAGVGTGAVQRGMVLTVGAAVGAAERLLVTLRSPVRLEDRSAPADWPPTPGSRLRLHLGTASVEATIVRGPRSGATLPDGRQVATLRLGRPIAAAVGDVFVLRVASPPATAAGGVVIDREPPTGASRRRIGPDALARLALARDGSDQGAVLAAEVALHGIVVRPEVAPRSAADSPPEPGPLDLPPTVRALGRWFLEASIAATLAAEALSAVGDGSERAPGVGRSAAELRRVLVGSLRRLVTVDERDAVAIADAILDDLVERGRLARSGDRIRDPRVAELGPPPPVLAAMDRLEMALATSAPPPLAEAARRAGCPPEGVRALESSGRIVRVDDDLAWAAPTYRELEALALRLATPGPLTPAALRDGTGTSRKYVMALLEDLDRRGLLRRTPVGHVPGPRAPR